MPSPVLTSRALNRALLARQMLLAREECLSVDAIERLAGLQAQQARPPFVGLWSRLARFRREDLHSLLREGQVVRATLMRCTLHLMSRRDYLAFRPALQPALTQGMRSILRDRLETFDLEAVLGAARELFAKGPRTFTPVRAALAERFPQGDERAMGYAVRLNLPLLSAPEDHPWGFRADAPFALTGVGSAEPRSPETSPHELVLRCLVAFGPASAADVQAWSGLQGLAPVLRELRPRLEVFRDERRRELFDLPEAPRPPEDTPAPARFVADFDNLILSHADRTRVIADAHRPAVITRNALVLPTILVDGFVAGTWKLARARQTAVLAVMPFAALPAAAREELAAEAEPLARFLEPDAAALDLRFEA